MEPDDILERLVQLERRDGELGKSIGYLRDALIVSAALQDRMERAQQRHVEDLDNLRQFSVERFRAVADALGSVSRALASLAEGVARHEEHLRVHEEHLRMHEEQMRIHEKRMAYIDERLGEITDKLNGLIGYIDEQRREPPPAG